MSRFIIERYIHDALTARATLSSDAPDARRELARAILRDIDIYFADHMDELLDARARLATRKDPDGRAMLAFVDETLASFEDADEIARDAIERASRG